MAFYRTLGKIPSKRHTQFRDRQKIYIGKSLSAVMDLAVSVNLYHLNPPTNIKKIGSFKKIELSKADVSYRHHHMKTSKLKKKRDIHIFESAIVF